MIQFYNPVHELEIKPLDIDMECNHCKNKAFDIIKSIDTIYLGDGNNSGMAGSQFGGSSDKESKFLIFRIRKIGTKYHEMKERINIYACQKCGNLQINQNIK